MTQKAPGKAHRRGLTLLQVADQFRNEDAARNWLEKLRWPNGPFCPKCGTFNVQCGIKHKSMTHRCQECKGRPMFTIRMGTVMAGTKTKFRVWATGIYLFTTNIKGISSMRLHRELGFGQKAAWFMLQRLRKAMEMQTDPFSGLVEVDEIDIGGKRKNLPAGKRKELTGREAKGKTALVGAKDRTTNKVTAEFVERADAQTLKDVVKKQNVEGAEVCTDDFPAYRGLPNHQAVTHQSRSMCAIKSMPVAWKAVVRCSSAGVTAPITR